jgi:hypothetical protein
MVETADRLASATLNGRPLSFGYGVLIHAMRGWHVALYELPARTREALAKGGHLVVETVLDHYLSGDVVPELVTPKGEYVLLTGTGLLSLETPQIAA